MNYMGMAMPALLLVLAAGPLQAMDIEGFKLDEQVTVDGGKTQLLLNGAGVRYKMALVKVYVGALYLAAHRNDPEEIIRNPGAKRISMHVLADEITAQEFIASLNNALAANHIPAELALLRIWIGKKPVDGRLRDAMLGTAAGARPK